MPSSRHTTFMGFLIVLMIGSIGPPTVRAQGAGRSLGGYGAATIGRYYGSGQGSYLPYNGNASGFVPYQGGYAGGLGVQPIPRRLPRTPVGGTSMPLTPIGGASLYGGMAGGGRPAFLPFGYEGGIGMPGGLIGLRH